MPTRPKQLNKFQKYLQEMKRKLKIGIKEFFVHGYSITRQEVTQSFDFRA